MKVKQVLADVPVVLKDGHHEALTKRPRKLEH
jgi:hypothetical protein